MGRNKNLKKLLFQFFFKIRKQNLNPKRIIRYISFATYPSTGFSFPFFFKKFEFNLIFKNSHPNYYPLIFFTPFSSWRPFFRLVSVASHLRTAGTVDQLVTTFGHYNIWYTQWKLDILALLQFFFSRSYTVPII